MQIQMKLTMISKDHHTTGEQEYLHDYFLLFYISLYFLYHFIQFNKINFIFDKFENHILITLIKSQRANRNLNLSYQLLFEILKTLGYLTDSLIYINYFWIKQLFRHQKENILIQILLRIEQVQKDLQSNNFYSNEKLKQRYILIKNIFYI
ncbi:hypothetical protein pb186bvf_007698 [Paramecium bursaria]